MNHIVRISPPKRIHSIDALRGFALIGIMLLHCMERFDLTLIPVVDNPFMQRVDTFVYEALYFLFAGKSYALFSLLFGLSFFMQMDSQANKGVDFTGRFVWRLALLFVFGYINGLVYMGEFFLVYALLGLLLVPFYKVPTRWLVVLAVLLFLQIPAVVSFVSLLGNDVPNRPTALVEEMNGLYEASVSVFSGGSFADVIAFNSWNGQWAKLLWGLSNFRYFQLFGLFLVGLLIGRSGIHKDEVRMVACSRKYLPYALSVFIVFYAIAYLLPCLGVEGYALRVGQTLFKTYGNLGQMMFYACGLVWLYYRGGKKVLDCLAPVGRMSVTNYMLQSMVGVIFFYGFGFDGAAHLNYLESFLFGVLFCLVQILYSNWWMKRYYYGPMEWLWRVCTWLDRVPFRRAANR